MQLNISISRDVTLRHWESDSRHLEGIQSPLPSIVEILEERDPAFWGLFRPGFAPYSDAG